MKTTFEQLSCLTAGQYCLGFYKYLCSQDSVSFLLSCQSQSQGPLPILCKFKVTHNIIYSQSSLLFFQSALSALLLCISIIILKSACLLPLETKFFLVPWLELLFLQRSVHWDLTSLNIKHFNPWLWCIVDLHIHFSQL